MAGTVITDTINTASGIQSTNNALLGCAKAFATFNGLSGASPVIKSSYNVSSITRNSTGNYTVSMTTAMADANYTVLFGGYNASGEGGWNTVTSGITITTSQFGIACFNSGGTAQDQTTVFFAVHGNG
jgi:hypothetical protein